MGIIDGIFGGKAAAERRAAAARLYAAAVAAARQPVFYARHGVPDTIDGRFDLVALHVHLLCRRLGEVELQPLAQRLFDAMIRDFELNLREMGVSDLSVPKKIKAMAKAYFGRAAAYDRALAEGDAAIAATLARNLYNVPDAVPTGANAIAAYIRRAGAALREAPATRLRAGYVAFSAPDEA